MRVDTCRYKQTYVDPIRYMCHADVDVMLVAKITNLNRQMMRWCSLKWMDASMEQVGTENRLMIQVYVNIYI